MNTRTQSLVACAAIALLASAAMAQQATKVYEGNISVKTVVPVISVETTGPSEINVGKTATFVITVKNVGDTPAEAVMVRTQLPDGVQFESANPKPEAVESGMVRFYIGDLPAQASRRIMIHLIPQKRGPVDLATTASFSTSTRSSLTVRKSSLKVKAIGPAKAMYGQTVPLKLIVSNNGDGDAEGVTIVPQVPEQALINAESAKPIEVGTLPAGESREVLYALQAAASGTLEFTFETFDASGAKFETRGAIRVLRPMLNVSIEGPSLRYVNRPADYVIRVSNPGDAPAENVEVVAAIDPNTRVTAIARAAKFDRESNSLTWYLPTVDPGSEIVLPLKTVATQLGEGIHHVVATNKAGLVANAERATQVIGRANLYATIINADGATELYQPANFTILLVNRGWAPAESVEVMIELPDGLEALPNDELAVEGNIAKFDPMTINVGEQRELHFQTIGRTTGEQVLRVQYKDASMTQPLSMEGIAFFYSDKQPGELAERVDIQPIAPQQAPQPALQLHPQPALQLQVPTVAEKP